MARRAFKIFAGIIVVAMSALVAAISFFTAYFVISEDGWSEVDQAILITIAILPIGLFGIGTGMRIITAKAALGEEPCSECGYELLGLIVERCPECQAAVPQFCMLDSPPRKTNRWGFKLGYGAILISPAAWIGLFVVHWTGLDESIALGAGVSLVAVIAMLSEPSEDYGYSYYDDGEAEDSDRHPIGE